MLQKVGPFKLLGHDEALSTEFLLESQREVGKLYLDAQGVWGRMKPEQWNTFIDWLLTNNCLTNRAGETIGSEAIAEIREKLFTNKFFA